MIPWAGIRILPHAGVLTFTLTARTSTNAEYSISRQVEVGIRTDDVIVVGWINQLGVPDPAAETKGVSARVLDSLPPSGIVTDSTLCDGFIGSLSQNITGFTIPFTLEGFSNVALSPADRTYTVDWMFRFAPNPDPATVLAGGDFRDFLFPPSAPATDETKVAAFANQRTNYKLFNRLQVKERFVLDPITGEPILNVATNAPMFNGAPIPVHPPVANHGTTKNPCRTT